MAEVAVDHVGSCRPRGERERSIFLVGIGILSKRTVKNLDLLRGLHVVLGRIAEWNSWRWGGAVLWEGLHCNEAYLLRMLKDKWRPEQRGGWVSCFCRILVVKAYFSEGVAVVACL